MQLDFELVLLDWDLAVEQHLMLLTDRLCMPHS